MKSFIHRLQLWWLRHKPSKRRFVQLYAALLFNANVKGFIKGDIFQGLSKGACVPGLNCYSCPGAIGACPLGSLQSTLNVANKSTFYYVIGILMLYGLIFGRTICGWLCPFGMFQELAYKIKSPKIKKNRFTRLLSYLKYVILAIFVIIIPLMYMNITTLPAFCKYICPAGIFEGAFPLLSHNANGDLLGSLGVVFNWKFFLFVGFFIACIFMYRFFCRFLCPLGAIYSLFNKFCLIGVTVNRDSCTECGKCIKHCKMDVKRVGDHECINCGECIDVCPTKAISWKGNPFKSTTLVNDNTDEQTIESNVSDTETNNCITDNPPKKKRNKIKIALQITALVTLVGAIVYSNFFVKDESEGETPVTILQVGDSCVDLTFKTLNKTEDITTESLKGKITFLNFWNLACGPCLNEMPHFEDFYNEYSEDVNFIAINVKDDIETVDEKIYEFFEGYNLTFAYDETGYIMKNFTNTTAFPYTVILDRDGVIVDKTGNAMSKDEVVAKYNLYK